MAIEEEPPPGVPEWVVTFGDMMSLLLTFFIMLVSMSEIKQEEKFQAMLDSMRQQFGYDAASSAVPGEPTLQNANLAMIASQGRARRKNLVDGGTHNRSQAGEEEQVQTIRPGRNSTTGGVLYFSEDSAELTPALREQLVSIAKLVAGKPQKIEVRGHSSRKPVDPALGYRDHWQLAFQRCHTVMDELAKMGIEPERMRLGSAGAFEPVDQGLDEAARRRNARVEVLLWDEVVSTVTTPTR